MNIKLRHKRFPLEKSLPRGLYYSTDPDKAKKLIHIKLIKKKLRAIRRTYLFELPRCKDRSSIMKGYRNNITAIEERYTGVVLPRQIVLILTPGRRRDNSKVFNQRLQSIFTTNLEK